MYLNDQNYYCTITMHNDSSISLQFRVLDPNDALESGKKAREMLDKFSLGLAIGALAEWCIDIDGTMIVPKETGFPDDLRLAISLAMMFPSGLTDEEIREKLGISDNSRRAYINSPQKRTSVFINYDKTTKLATILEEGVSWIHAELEKRGQNND